MRAISSAGQITGPGAAQYATKAGIIPLDGLAVVAGMFETLDLTNLAGRLLGRDVGLAQPVTKLSVHPKQYSWAVYKHGVDCGRGCGASSDSCHRG